jgi:hypothetical protein
MAAIDGEPDPVAAKLVDALALIASELRWLEFRL